MVQEFGKETDALLRIQRQDGAEKEQMAAINKVKDRLGSEFEYRRTEFVGPTVGKELKENKKPRRLGQRGFYMLLVV